MDDPKGNTPRTSTTQKSVSRDPATKSDERVEKKKRRNERDEGSGSSDEGHDSTSRSVTRFKAYKGKGSRKETEVIQQQKAVLHRFESQYRYCEAFMQDIFKESYHFECLGLSANSILQNIKEKVRILLKYMKNHNISIEQDLELFQKKLYDIFVNSNPYKYKTIGVPKIDKFRSVCPVGTREAKIEESGEDVCNIISKIIVLQDAVVTYSELCKTICCATSDKGRNEVHCPSSVTDFTRIGQKSVLATLPFRQMILIINPSSLKLKTLSLGFYMVSYLQHSTFIGVEMFGKTIYLVDWDDNEIIEQFVTKELPADIAVGSQNNLLISFTNINRVICYNLNGQQLFEVEVHSLDLPTNIAVYQNHFYVLQGHIIYRISATGAVSKREIGRRCRYISVGKDTIFLIDYLCFPHTIKTNKDFWSRLSYSHQLHSHSLNNYIYTEDCNNITNILPMTTSSILIIYKNKKAIFFTDIGGKISQNNLTFDFPPSIFCKLNSNSFLVFHREMKRLQYITCPELNKGPLIKVHADYIKICHMVSNRCLALTTSDNKQEIHILLIKEDKVDIIERISLEHDNVTIAATPINFVVLDRRKNKLVFYSASSEKLFEKYLQFYGYPHHIQSDNIYFYVFFKKESVVICYNIHGEIKWQWKLPFPVHPHIAIFQGTVYVPDIEHNRVLLYEYYDQSSCRLHVKTPYIRNLNIRLKEKENDKKTLIVEICHLVNGQLVVSDINSDCLLYISNEGEIVSRLSLPSTATDICRWDCNQIGVTLPLEKQLQVIGNLSKTVRTISLSHAYVKVCKLGKGHIVCYSDKPSQLDILAIKNYNQVEMIRRINIPFVVKSLEIENETLNLLIVTRNKVFQYNTSIDSVGHSCRNSIKMIPRDFLSGVKHSLNFSGGCIDKMFVYLIGNNRVLAINDHNLVGRDHIMNNQLILYIDLLDVFSRNICVGEMWSSTLYVQDMTVSDKARHVIVPPGFGDEKLVRIDCLVITENNLIAVYDSENRNIKILTFDGQLLDFIKLEISTKFKSNINMCRWQSNTLIITTGDNDNKYQLLTLKVEFPLSLTIYQTENEYEFIASLSNNQLACHRRGEAGTLYVIEIDEEFLTVNRIKKLDAGGIIITSGIDNVHDIITDANDVIIVNNKRYFVFFNTDGEHLHSVRHYMDYSSISNTMTTDNCYLYVHGRWERYFGDNKYNNILCFTQTGEYSRRFLNDRIYKDEVNFSSINCKGPRFVGSCSNINKLYVEGLFQVKREIFPVSRLLTDKCPIQVKDIDISDEGKTIVCEKANNGIVKIFDRDGQMLCHKDVRSLVGGVCFTGESDIMVTIPKRQEIFQLKQQDLEKYKVWQSHVPYGVIWRAVANIYWCVHINLIEYHRIKIDGDQLKVLESLSLLNLDSGLHFPFITSQMNKKIFSHELINNLEQSRGDGEGRKGKSNEIVSKGRLKVRCGNYIAESMSGIEEVSVKKLPYRTAMVPLSIPTVEEPVDYHYKYDSNDSKLIKLYDNFSVFMFRDTVTLICTTTGDILQQKQLPQQPSKQPPSLDICRWTGERFIVVCRKRLMVFNRDLYRLKTINTEKYYNRICKYNDNQLVCGGISFSRESYRVYVDVLDIDIDNGTCERKNEMYSEVVKMRMLMRKEVGLGVLDIAVTSSGDVVVVKWKNDSQDVVVLWYREKSLVNSICLPKCTNYLNFKHRPCLTTLGDYVYVTDRLNNIYQIPGDIPHQTSEDIHKYLLLRTMITKSSKCLVLIFQTILSWFLELLQDASLLLSFIMKDKRSHKYWVVQKICADL
ncbi:uncharacterized protein LOC118768319 isoform X2 [Octopus sinensis]|uniref:Uncharacterized protein LOC118768319 isoform X2 n=1 Tax=Octopus sinensis TaxID=2607531 RepID=A0A7E6FS66_9MOLL|nr:uncharacterized protein LOC118768319 isoform X2 [Octopus sinensis]